MANVVSVFQTSALMKVTAYKRYLLVVLMLVLAVNGIDSLTLGLVLQNIKVDLHLTDTQLGVLSGIAFALFYSIMGIPIARWADRGNRVTIIALTVVVWSVMVALCSVGPLAPMVSLATSRWSPSLERLAAPLGHTALERTTIRPQEPTPLPRIEGSPRKWILSGSASVSGEFAGPSVVSILETAATDGKRAARSRALSSSCQRSF